MPPVAWRPGGPFRARVLQQRALYEMPCREVQLVSRTARNNGSMLHV